MGKFEKRLKAFNIDPKDIFGEPDIRQLRSLFKSWKQLLEWVHLNSEFKDGVIHISIPLEQIRGRVHEFGWLFCNKNMNAVPHIYMETVLEDIDFPLEAQFPVNEWVEFYNRWKVILNVLSTKNKLNDDEYLLVSKIVIEGLK